MIRAIADQWIRSHLRADDNLKRVRNSQLMKKKSFISQIPFFVISFSNHFNGKPSIFRGFTIKCLQVARRWDTSGGFARQGVLEDVHTCCSHCTEREMLSWTCIADPFNAAIRLSNFYLSCWTDSLVSHSSFLFNWQGYFFDYLVEYICQV